MKRKPKWTRWKIGVVENIVLHHTLFQTQYPDDEEISSLAVLLDVDQRRVKVWFQNKRQRLKDHTSTNV